MNDEQLLSDADIFCTLALESGLVNQESVDECLAEHLHRSGHGHISGIFLEKGYLKDVEVKGLYTAMNRLERDAGKSEIYIPGYKIITKIGDGGLGTVYKAKQLTMNRFVALKVLHPKWLSDKEFYYRFILEARIIGKLSHQNLLQVYDFGRHEEHMYFSMEFIDGETVDQYIEVNGPMPVGVATNIVIQVARGLNYIKDFDIVHRDVKPGNVLLTRNGVAKLGDFGFLKSIYDSDISDDGEVLGTPDYIAPEQAEGKEVDFRSDIYSLGITFYQMLSGKVPYEGSPSAVIEQHISAKVPRITDINKTVPPEVVEIIRKMVAKDPEKRYKSFTRLFNELESVRLRENLSGSDPNISPSSILQAYRGESSCSAQLRSEVDRLNGMVRILSGLVIVLALVLIGILIAMVGNGS